MKVSVPVVVDADLRRALEHRVGRRLDRRALRDLLTGLLEADLQVITSDYEDEQRRPQLGGGA